MTGFVLCIHSRNPIAVPASNLHSSIFIRSHPRLNPSLARPLLTRGSKMLLSRGMSQPVKLSDALVLDARLAAEGFERSIAGQVEFWARLGRAIEPLLQGAQALALSRNAAAFPLSSCIKTVDSPEGRRRVSEFLLSQPYPHYEPVADSPGLLVRIEENGRRTVGRFVNREFVPVKAKAARR